MSRHDEVIAARVIEIEHSVVAQVHDDGSKPSMVDLLLMRDATVVGCAEISRITNADGQRGEAILARQNIEAPDLRWTWDCAVRSTSVRRGDNERVAALLARLEAAGVERLDGPIEDATRAEVRDVARLLAQLGVGYARVVGHQRGLVILGSMGFSMSRGPEDVLAALGEFFAEHTDVAAKLVQHSGPERHAFLWVDHHHWGSWRALDGEDLPGSPPLLPVGVTHVWVAPWTSWDNIEHQRGWVWNTTEGWRAFSIPLDQIGKV